MRSLRLAALVVTAAVVAAANSRAAPQPRSAIMQLFSALESAREPETIQWSSPLTRGLMSLMSALLSPLLRRAAILLSPLTLPGQLGSGNFTSGSWRSSDLTVHGLETLGLVAVSPDAVLNERTGESHYLVRVHTTANAITDDAGRRLPIGPGMGAEVNLLGDKRTVLAYILTPLTRLSETAFRE